MRISRSAVTERVQQLEAFVGAPLFVRNTRSVRLSELGQTFLHECADLVRRTDEVVNEMREVTIVSAVIFWGLHKLFSDCGTWYLLGLGLLAIGVTIFFKQGLWGWAQLPAPGRLACLRRSFCALALRHDPVKARTA